MEMAQVVAGFSLGQADILRRAMGKKKPEEMLKMKEKFLAGAKAQGIRRDDGGEDLRAALRLQRLRVQQEPRRRVRHPRLPHDLAEGESPRGVHRRQLHQRHERHRQARAAHPRGAGDGHPGAAAGREPVCRRISPSRTGRSSSASSGSRTWDPARWMPSSRSGSAGDPSPASWISSDGSTPTR